MSLTELPNTALAPLLKEAIIHHENGDFTEAEQIYRKILHIQPNHTQANYNLGVLALQQQNPTLAQPFFTAALESDPDREQCWLACIEVLLQTGQMPSARLLLEQAQQVFGYSKALQEMSERLATFINTIEQADNPAAPTDQPQMQEMDTLIELCATEQYKEAEPLAREFANRFPHQPFGWKALGVVLENLGRQEEALASMQHALDLQPADAESHFNLGNIYKSLHRLTEAEASYRNALSLNPELADTHANLGETFHKLGQLKEAEASYRQALSIKPNYVEAINSLGTILNDMGRVEEAESCYSQALAINPDYANAMNNLGISLAKRGRLSDAEKHYRRALELTPDFAECHSNLGSVLRRQGRLDEATKSFRIALELSPQNADMHKSLGSCLFEAGDANAAAEAFRRTLALQANDAGTMLKLGRLLREQEHLDEAVAQFQAVILLTPNSVEAHHELGVCLVKAGKKTEAEAAFRKVLEIDPKHATSYSNLGVCLMQMNRNSEAEFCFQRAIEIDPQNFDARGNLGSMLANLGRIEEGNAILQKMANSEESQLWVQSNLLFSLTHTDSVTPERLYQEHRAFGLKAESKVSVIEPHKNTKDPERKLRIGFVSGDLCSHPVALFIEPVWRLMDKSSFDLYAYSSRTLEDSNSKVLQKRVSVWHRVSGLSDQALADQIRKDEIDILVDLSGHTASNRLEMFAFKPAPIQASWIGYPATTGLEAMDYYLADKFCAPAGMLDEQFTEKLVRLPVAWAFQPANSSVPLAVPPALRTGTFTFGSFNRISKLTDSTVKLWSRVLQEAPTARMLLGGVKEKAVEQHLVSRFEQFGIKVDRLIFHPRVGLEEYLNLHNEVDLLLDSLPYSGGTTTNHALWMGVPTLTLAGTTLPGRQGAALMNHVGLPEFVAESEDDFVSKAVAWSRNIPELTVIRAGMRVRINASELRSPARVARGVETAFREMWRRWCRGESPESFGVE